MTSTRNKNTQLDYKLHTQLNNNLQQNNLYIHSSSGRPITECMPTIGYMPSHMSRDTLANNPIDIESTLYGIGSSNLVKPCEPVNPNLKTIAFKDWFQINNTVIMPRPLVFNNEQRPFPI